MCFIHRRENELTKLLSVSEVTIVVEVQVEVVVIHSGLVPV